MINIIHNMVTSFGPVIQQAVIVIFVLKLYKNVFNGQKI